MPGLLAPLLAAALACSLISPRAEAKRLTLADLGTEVGLAQPAISPDGKHIVLVTSRADYVDNRFTHSLVLIDVITRAQELLAPERQQVRLPQWSPSGDQLAFLDREQTGVAQIYVLSMDDARRAATRITATTQDVLAFRWSPDGASFAFITADPPQQRTGDERHNRSFEVHESDYLATAASAPAHIWMISTKGGAAQRLTAGEESVTDIEWLAGSQTLAFISQGRSDISQRRNKALKTLDVRTGKQRVLVPYPTFLGFSGQPLRSSPDGRLIAYRYYPGPEVQYRPAVVAVVPAAGGEARDLTRGLDRSILLHAWMSDGKGILTVGPDRTRHAAWLQGLDGVRSRLDLGSVTWLAFFDDVAIGRSGAVAFIGSEPQRPPELHYMTSLRGEPQRLTNFNAHLAARDLGQVEAVRWAGPDGFEEDGVLVYPPGFTGKEKHPLVLNIHGGPMGTDVTAWHGFNQLMATRGWIVFSPNYRGSNSMGQAFQMAIVNDAGDGPGRDIMAGIDAIKARGIVDEDRIAVSGFSYGGILTVWLTAHYQIWRAAVAAAASTDWVDYYSLSDFNLWLATGFGGSPWLGDNAMQNYRRQSAITYAHRIRTPMLILSNTGDRRAPITQSYKLYHALRDNGVHVKFVAYPVDSHVPADPVHTRDFQRRWIDWIDQQFRAALGPGN